MLREYIKDYRAHEGIPEDKPLEEIDFVRALQWSASGTGEMARQGVDDYKDLVIDEWAAKMYFNNFEFVCKNGLMDWVKVD